MAANFSVVVNIGGKVGPSLGSSISTAKTMLGGLASSVGAVNARTAAAITGASRAVQKAGKSMQDAGRSLTAGVSAPLGLLGMGAGKMAFEFELAGNKLEALGDATVAQRKEFEAFANVLNAKYPQSLAGIINTGNEMLKGGFNFDQMKGAIDQTLATAVLGDMSPAEVGNMMSRTINAFQLPMQTFADSQRSASRVSDQMTYAAVKTTASLKDMGEMYRYVGGASSAAGISLEQASGFAMAFAKNGSVGSDAGVAMRSAIVRMVKMPAKGLAAMKRIGMNLGDYQGGKRKVTAASIVGGLEAEGIDAKPVQSQIAKLLHNPKIAGDAVKLGAEVSKLVQGAVTASGSAMDASAIANSVQESIVAAGSKVDLVKFFVDLKKKFDSGQAGLGDLATILEGRHASRYMPLLQSDLPKLIADLTKESEGYTQARLGKVNHGIVAAVYGISASMEKLSVSLGRGIFPTLATGINTVSDAVDKLSEASPAVMKFAGTAGLAAIALGPFLMAGGATVRVVGLLATGLLQLGRAATIGLAARLLDIGVSIRNVAFAATLSAVTRVRAMAAGLIALNAVGGAGAVLGAIGGGLLRTAGAVLMFPVTALRAIGVAMWGLVANPVGIAITGIVVGLAALGVWVSNNLGGIGQFFTSFGDGFMKALGPGASGAVTGTLDALRSAWEWVSKLLGPIDETGAKWKGWGEAAGAAAGAVVTGIANLPGKIVELGGTIATATGDLAKRAAHSLAEFDWKSTGRAIVDGIIAGISGMGDALAAKLSGLAGGAADRVRGLFGLGPAAAGPAAVPSPVGSTPARATGGSIHGGHAYMVGERGPELIVPGGSGTVIPNGNLPAGMRNNNPANLKYARGVNWRGLVGPSKNTDQGDPQAVFGSAADGMRAAALLARNKYNKGMRSAADLIAGKGGWTAGSLAFPASVNIAKAMGLGRGDDMRLNDPAQMHKFMRGLLAQEQGGSAKLYSDSMIAQGINAAGMSDTLAKGYGRAHFGQRGGAGALKPGEVHPALTKMIARASQILGVPLSTVSGFRSREHNAAVGGARNSLHTQGRASDLSSPGHGKNDPAFWAKVNGAMRQAAAEQGQAYRWGGTFGGKYKGDWNHFDIGQGGPGGAVARAVGARARGYARAQFGKGKPKGDGVPAPALPAIPPGAMAAVAASSGGTGSTKRTRFQGGAISVEVNVNGAGGSPDEVGRQVAYEVRKVLAQYESEQRGMLSD